MAMNEFVQISEPGTLTSNSSILGVYDPTGSICRPDGRSY